MNLKEEFNYLLKKTEEKETLPQDFKAIKKDGLAAVSRIDNTVRSIAIHEQCGMNLGEGNLYAEDQAILKECIGKLKTYNVLSSKRFCNVI
jgi:hypothetical protein